MTRIIQKMKMTKRAVDRSKNANKRIPCLHDVVVPYGSKDGVQGTQRVCGLLIALTHNHNPHKNKSKPPKLSEK